MQPRGSNRGDWMRPQSFWKSTAWPFAITLVLLALWGASPDSARAETQANVSDKIAVSFTGLTLNRSTNTFDTLATLTNSSAVPVSQPVVLAVTGISPGTVTLANAAGLTADGYHYVRVPLADGQFDPGERVTNVILKFANPSRAKFSFTRAVYGLLPSVNSPPVANAGLDRTVYVGDSVALDGSGSRDQDGDALTYLWTLTEKPVGSAATLTGAGGPSPSFAVDKSGSYRVKLVVNDGKTESAPAFVVVSTLNSRPRANAGSDRTAAVGQTVVLDGSASSDADGDSLDYLWSLTQRPGGSAAILVNPDTDSPRLAVDKPGHYEASLVVSDGTADSDPDLVAVDTRNSLPVADAGPDLTGHVGDEILLDGRASSDADGDLLTYAWSLLSKPNGSSATILDDTALVGRLKPDAAGDYIAQLIVHDGSVAGQADTAKIVVSLAPPPVNHAPDISSTPVVVATVGQVYRYGLVATDQDGDALSFSLTLSPAGMAVDPQSGAIDWTPAAAGSFPVVVQVSDGKGGTASQSFDIQASAPPTVQVPDLAGLTRDTASEALAGAGLVLGDVTETRSSTVPAGQVVSQVPGAGSTVAPGTAVAIVVSMGDVPPDPASVAPPIDPTVTTTIDAASQFLYSGSDPIQTGVAPGTIEPKRAAVIRGRVLDKANVPLPGVTIAIKDHPELGETLSRTDGWFDMAVNGGGTLTLDYTKPGYLPAQRQIETRWQDYSLADDLVLVAQDSKLTRIDLTDASQPFQVAQGSVVTDADGTRQATLLIPQGTQAQIYNADGTTRQVDTLSLRLTEYTVGANGPQSMPAELPPSSAYTYAFEMKAEEASLKRDGKDVLFDRPVPFYIDNFLNFPVGTIVPVGYYNKDKATWIPSENGRVVKVLAVANGTADLDTDGDGIADDAAKLAALNITVAERERLAALYPAGSSLWRVQVTHLSTWDCNWPFMMPRDAVAPKQKIESKDKQKLCGTCGEAAAPTVLPANSTVEAENQTLRESLALTGTGLSLNYASDRVPGKTAANQVVVPLSGATLPASLKRIDMVVEVAGRKYEQSFVPERNKTVEFDWDGQDAYGRTLSGAQTATVKIAYAYDPVYATPAELSAAFGRFSGVPLEGSRARNEVRIWQEEQVTVSRSVPQSQDVGDWSLSAHHRYDPSERVLYLGDGSRQSASAISAGGIISIIAGNGICCDAGDGGSALDARLSVSYGLAVGPDGSIFLSDQRRIRKISPDGIIRPFAGAATEGYSGDGGPATQATLSNPYAIALGPDGSLYIADWGNARIRRVYPNGIIETIAGTGVSGHSGDGQPAISARILATYIAVGPDGSVYLSSRGYARVRKITPDGLINTIAGTGVNGFSGDGGPALSARLSTYPGGLALGPDGSLYIADTGNARVRRVSPDGIISTVAGNGETTPSGDGGLAVLAGVDPDVLSVNQAGDLFISDVSHSQVRIVGEDGMIRTLAGGGTLADYDANGSPGTAVRVASPYAIAADPSGTLIVSGVNHLHRVSSAYTGFTGAELAIPSADGSALYRFDATGRHLSTIDAITGTTLLSFAYDTAGRLAKVTDANGLETVIQRDAQGRATALLAPFGQQTAFATGANGELTEVRNPAGEAYRLGYGAGGLLTSFRDPRGNASTFSYDANGWLVADRNAVGGQLGLTRTELADGRTIEISTAMGRTSSHTLRDLATGERERTHVSADGTATTTLETPAGTVTTTLADGTVSAVTQGPDSRFGMLAPIASSATLASGGLTATLSATRTATLATPTDPLSLTQLTDTSTVNGRRSTSVYDAATRTLTATSPANRQSIAVLDALGRVTQAQVTGILPVNASYDAQGRLATVTQGTGADARTLGYAYDANGHLASVTDPLGRSVQFQYDLAGRVTTQTLPDERADPLRLRCQGQPDLVDAARSAGAPLPLHGHRPDGRLCAAGRGRRHQRHGLHLRPRQGADLGRPTRWADRGGQLRCRRSGLVPGPAARQPDPVQLRLRCRDRQADRHRGPGWRSGLQLQRRPADPDPVDRRG